MLSLSVIVLLAASDKPLHFERTKISDTTYEACSVFNVDRDGHLDIVSGAYWYPGPAFTARHKICDVEQVNDYYDDFADFPLDVNGDGYLDIVSGAWFGKTLTWRENPRGRTTEWNVHDIAHVGNIERPCFWDIDGDGALDIVPNTPGNPQRIVRIDKNNDGASHDRFRIHTISDIVTGHGLGFGDINGDGRGDLVVRNGWFEGPEKPFRDEWRFHKGPNLYESAGVPILVHDVNEDGLVDLIVGAGHDYGLAWWEHAVNADGDRTWVKHDIETDRSQFHELALADLDNDGAMELITGKRWRAHSGNDPGADDPVGLYYYEINGGHFERHDIDYGAPTEASGTGIYLWVSDIDGNGWQDILAPGKEGLYLFRNMGANR